jgi:hypothetical protein
VFTALIVLYIIGIIAAVLFSLTLAPSTVY